MIRSARSDPARPVLSHADLPSCSPALRASAGFSDMPLDLPDGDAFAPGFGQDVLIPHDGGSHAVIREDFQQQAVINAAVNDMNGFYTVAGRLKR